MASEVLDIIHNLSYTVTGADSLENIKGNFVKQGEQIEQLKKQLASLNIAYANETGVKAQQNLSGAIEKVTATIEKKTEALKKQIAASKPLQQAIEDEIGLIQQLNEFIKQHTKERATLTDASQIKTYTTEIKAAQAELNSLLGKSVGAQKPDQGIRQVGAIEALENRLKILQNTKKTVSAENIPIINSEIDKTKAKLQDLNGVQKDTTTTGDKLTSMFERMGLRMILNLFVFQAAIEAGQYLYRTTTENIQGTDNYIEKQKKLTAAMNSFNDILIKQVDTLGSLDKAIGDYFNAGESSFKNEVDRLKAVGVVDGKIFDAEKTQLAAEQELRKQQLSDLEAIQGKYSQVRQIFAQYDKSGDLGGVRKALKGLGLEPKELREFNTQIDEYVTARKKLDPSQQKDFKLSENDELFKKQSEIQTKINANQGESINAQLAFESKINKEIFDKQIELNKQKRSEDEKYRELKEKEDIGSVDKIIKDAQAKYKGFLKQLELDAKKTKEAVGDEAFNRKDKNGNSLSGTFAAIRRVIKGQQSQDIGNQTFEFNRSQFFTQEQDLTAEAKTASEQSAFNGSFGLPSYDKIVAAKDAATKAELAAAQSTFEQLSEKYRQSGQSTVAIEKQYSEQVREINLKSYRDRLSDASDYLAEISKRIDAVAHLELTIATTDILTGGTGLFGRPNKQLLAEGRSKIDTGNAKRAAAVNAVGFAQNNFDIISPIDAESQAKKAEAEAKLIQSKQTLADIDLSIATGEKQIHEAKVQQIEQEKGAFDSLVETTAKGYDIISQARQKDLDREIAVRTQRIEMAYKLAERGNTQALAQEQKALDAANQQKRQAAIQEQEVNAALTVSRLIAGIAAAVAEDNAGALVIIPLILAAAATGFAEASAITSAEQKQFFKGGYTGEGGKYEPAGVVHKGEFVSDKETTARFRPFLEAMHKGQNPFEVVPEVMLTKSMGGQVYVTTNDLKKHGDMIVGAILGKNVNVSQNIDKSGVHQIVVEETKAHDIKWRH